MRRQRPRSDHRPGLIQGHPLKRYLVRRFQPGKRPQEFEAQLLASDSYRSSRPVNQDEVAAILGRRRMCPRRGQFFRFDGFGIWAGIWDGGREQVRTYMTPTPRARRWPYPCRIHLQRRRACA